MSTAAERIERAQQRPLTSAEQAFFGVPDADVKPQRMSERMPLNRCVPEQLAVDTVWAIDGGNLSAIDGNKKIRDAAVADINVTPEVRERLHHTLLHDPRFNGAYGNGIGYSEFISRALAALEVK